MNLYKANIWKMYVFQFLLSLHFIGGVLVPFFLDWGRISFTQIMILQSVFVFSTFALEIPTGAVADHFGRKTSLIFGAIALAAGPILYTIQPNFYLFILAEIVWGAGGALLSGADEAFVYDSLKKFRAEKKSKKIFGRFHSFDMAALMIAAPIGSVIASYIGLKYAMMFMAIPFLLAVILALTFKEPETKKKIESKRYLKALFGGIKYFKSHKILKSLAFDKVLISALVFFIIWTYQPKLTALNVPIVYFGFVAAAITGIQIPFLINFERLEKFFRSKKRYILLSALIPGICFILLGFNPYVSIAIVLFLLIAGFGLSRGVLFNNYMNKHIESHNRATVISTISMMERLIKAILYPLIGLLVELSLDYTFWIVGIAIIVFALVSRVKEEHLID